MAVNKTSHNEYLGFQVVCASYVDQLYGIENPGFEAETDWRYVH